MNNYKLNIKIYYDDHDAHFNRVRKCVEVDDIDEPYLWYDIIKFRTYRNGKLYATFECFENNCRIVIDGKEYKPTLVFYEDVIVKMHNYMDMLNAIDKL